jgi:hypothetical protein
LGKKAKASNMDMKVRLACFLPLLIGLFSFEVFAADVTGVWKGQLTDREGSIHDVSFDLKAGGTNVTGTVAGMPPGSALAIENGKIEGLRLSFQISIGKAGEQPAQCIFTAQVAGNQMRGLIAGPQGLRYPFTATMRPIGTPSAFENSAESTGTTDMPQPPNPQGANPTPEDAQKAILALFDKYEVVGGMNPSEGCKDVDDFILALIRNPAFPDKVNDIAVEGGNSLYQSLLDRYIAGEDVPLSEAQQAWRNTTQPACDFSTLYPELFPLVRRINEKLATGKKLRVLALDPPIDWSKVKSQEDRRPYKNRDASIAWVMETEVLAKHRKALIIIGVSHVSDRGYGYEQKYPNATFVIDVWGFGGDTQLAKYNDVLEKRMSYWPIPSLVTIKGTWLADLPPTYFSPGVDGYLYLGPRDLLLGQLIPAKTAMDRAYMTELQRRADIRGRAMNPARRLQEEVESSVFFFEPAVKSGEQKDKKNRED